MLKLYHAPWTRSIRVLWLLEELGLPYELEKREFTPPRKPFSQDSPFGKIPVLDDDGVVIFESGAILEYILERYGEGRLAPPVGSPLRGPFLQWMHFAEGTAYPPLGTIIWHTRYARNQAESTAAVDDARMRAQATFDFLEEQLGDGPYILGETFCAADIMLAFTLGAARAMKVPLGPGLVRYWERLETRPAFRKATTSS